MFGRWSRGTIIAVYVAGLLHTAVYFGFDANGEEWVIDLAPDDKSGKGIRWRTMKQFARGSDELHLVNYPGAYEPEVIFWRAVGKLGQHNYNLWESNCQQFTRWCATNEWISDQLEQAKPVVTYLTGAIIATALVHLFKPARRTA